MKKPSVVIIGNGVVGANLLKRFPWAAVHDPAKEIFADDIKYDYAFICVQTPMLEDGSCDISYVAAALQELDAELFIIKSTVPPGTTQQLGRSHEVRVVFSPEYEGETQHANNVDYDFAILGGATADTKFAAQLFQHAYDARLRILKTTSQTAELAKYMENAYLATKVTFCNDFYRLANRIGVDYGELRELFVQDPRVGRSHTFVYEDAPFYDSKCLNKDVPAVLRFAAGVGSPLRLVQAVNDVNAMFGGR